MYRYQRMKNNYDYDQIVIGSGFGGSVSALRLTEKGNRVLVLEKGKKREDTDYPASNWDVKNAIWEPSLGMKGSLQISYTSKVSILHGVGVGGGSQIYANVHFIPDKEVFSSPSWSRIRNDWYDRLSPYFSLAQRMLGTTKSDYESFADKTLHTLAKEIGRGDSYKTVSTGVLFPNEGRQSGQAVADPYFDGEGPERKACTYCAGCIMGCRNNAKNTLTKNYLYFAERNGAEIRADSEVTKIEPILNELGGQDGSQGYLVTIRENKDGHPKTYTLKTRGVVLSAGVMGTIPLLLRMRDQAKALPNISRLLGQEIRTNSETLTSVNNMDKPSDDGMTITSFMSADDTTNMEINRFNEGGDATWFYTPYVPMVSGAGISRIFKLLLNTLKHPLKTAKILWPKGKGKSSIIFLVMQTSEAFVHFEWRRRWYRLFRKDITAVQKDNDAPLTVSFPSAEEATRKFAEKTGGKPGSSLMEILLGIPMTAHIMSGVAIGTDKSNGVIDESGEVFGYQNLRVLDGSIIPGNLGVNPSLTITALSEYAMSRVPIFDQERASQIKSVRFSEPLQNMVSTLSNNEAEELVRPTTL